MITQIRKQITQIKVSHRCNLLFNRCNQISVFGGDDINAIGGLETYHAVFKGEQCEIPALAHEKTGLKPGAFLPDKDASGFDELAAEALHPKTL